MKKIKRILFAVCVLLGIVLTDAAQAFIFDNKPLIKIVVDYNGGILYQKHIGILTNTYVFSNGAQSTFFKWEDISPAA
jgi:hypothetical protein